MFPGLGRINPKQMQAMMRQFGIKTEELNVEKVVFELKDKKMVIENPSVTALEMQGQKTFQVIGEVKEEAKELSIPKEDIDLVVEQAGVSREKAEEELRKVEGDIAQAIENLKKE